MSLIEDAKNKNPEAEQDTKAAAKNPAKAVEAKK